MSLISQLHVLPWSKHAFMCWCIHIHIALTVFKILDGCRCRLITFCRVFFECYFIKSCQMTLPCITYSSSSLSLNGWLLPSGCCRCQQLGADRSTKQNSSSELFLLCFSRSFFYRYLRTYSICETLIATHLLHLCHQKHSQQSLLAQHSLTQSDLQFRFKSTCREKRLKY